MSNNTTDGKSSRRRQIIIFGACSFFALIICVAVVLVTALTLITDGVYEFEDTYKPDSGVILDTKENIVAFLSNISEIATDDSRVYIDTETEIFVDDESIVFSGTEAEKKLLMYIKTPLIESIDKMYPENYSGEFGDGFTNYPVISLTPSDCSSAKCTEGSVDENGEPVDEDYYFFDITVPGVTYPPAEGSKIYDTFKLSDSGEIVQRILKDTSDIFTVISSEMTPRDFTINAKSNRLSYELSYIVLTRKYSINLALRFVGDYAQLGTKNLSFDFEIKETFNYTWAGISLLEDSLTVKPGESLAVTVNAVLNDYADYDVVFSTSDKNIATVDELGYVTGVTESTTPAIITVSLTYLGQEYSDTCMAYVLEPVKKIKISDDELTLSVGSSETLSAKITPARATNKEVIWISESPEIASVDDSGAVFAVSPGNAKIIAVSDDGHFMDTCTVTVTA